MVRNAGADRLPLYDININNIQKKQETKCSQINVTMRTKPTYFKFHNRMQNHNRMGWVSDSDI